MLFERIGLAMEKNSTDMQKGHGFSQDFCGNQFVFKVYYLG